MQLDARGPRNGVICFAFARECHGENADMKAPENLEYLTILDWVFVIKCHDCVAGWSHVIVLVDPRSKNALERSKEWMPWNIEKIIGFQGICCRHEAGIYGTGQIEIHTYIHIYIYMIYINILNTLVVLLLRGTCLERIGTPVRACTGLAMAVAKECKRSLDFCCPGYSSWSAFVDKPRDKSTSHLKVEYASPNDVGVKLHRTRTEVLKCLSCFS